MSHPPLCLVSIYACIYIYIYPSLSWERLIYRTPWIYSVTASICKIKIKSYLVLWVGIFVTAQSNFSSQTGFLWNEWVTILFAVPFVELRVKNVSTKKRSNRSSTTTLEINHFYPTKTLHVYTGGLLALLSSIEMSKFQFWSNCH